MHVGIVGTGILSVYHLCALSSMQCRETSAGVPMLLDGIIVLCAFSVIAIRVCDHQCTFESPLSPFFQSKGHRMLQRIDVGLVFDDL